MKKDIKNCNPELLDRYLDQELGPDDASMVAKHLEQCPSCQKALRENQAISGLFREKMHEVLSQVNLQAIETRVVAAIDDQRIPWWSALRNLFVSKRFYVPATAVVAGLVLLGVLLTPSPPVSAPSAIISSFKGDVGSVMFLETPKLRQTVIWFNEPVSPNDQNGAQGPEGSAILDFPRQRFHIA
jgi:anti-sigma factor RsiW